ncbi:MAG: pyruvate kinase, partial [Candidatus Roizmanbacteria bacterium]|nr:pyruvate kinase [Candidatus Roizmanbacteria bacterium]
MEKLTKIVATIGPACETEEQIEALITAGVNVFRFNFKHSTIDWHASRIHRVKQVAKKMKVHIGTLLDLQGPEIRINMPTENITVSVGELVTLGESVFSDGKKGFSCSHPDLFEFLKVGQHLIADDGAFSFTVMELKPEVILKCNRAGLLKNKKSLRIPGANFPFPVLVDRDFEGLKMAQRAEIDYIALSYARTADDVLVTRKEMAKYKVVAQIISKIEAKSAIDNLDEIIEVSDGIMVARGDLGIELPLEEVPYWQKIMIKKCIEKGIPVITATQMLQTMIDAPFPTRAEVSDVANATFDMTDAVMLSAESASGKYPLETVTMMKHIVKSNESRFSADTRKHFTFRVEDNEQLLCEAAYNIYRNLEDQKNKVSGFVVFTETGRTARMLSRYRPNVPIYAMVSNNKVGDMLTVDYGVQPVSHFTPYTRELVSAKGIAQIVEHLKEVSTIKKGQSLVIIY